ncbi:phytanoyl-CoA dioxygenase family protein [Salinibius halmophilus]|uniref:phytanoyl-CoA dioxygenase family protein n=1 Tax=Salinibius halmophilus TaxID=1853216 RepID=UPI000E665FC9|nr:phytanoyl-CoA dioxygenase family protein [Salinibius halmophilus]
MTHLATTRVLPENWVISPASIVSGGEVLTSIQINFFQQYGYLVLPGAALNDLAVLRAEAQRQLAHPEQPMELEATVGYPGAPLANAEGGDTVRRLLKATERSKVWLDWATSAQAKAWLAPLVNDADPAKKVWLNPNHHNCLMTKSPRYSSDTGWHQDIRYWQFKQPQLVSMWLALGDERTENGGLQVIPGSHAAVFSSNQFDEKKFFRTDFTTNLTWLEKSVSIELNAGDVLLFDSRLLHKASRNHSELTKLSLVFTYHGESNYPIAGTRSASQPEIKL